MASSVGEFGEISSLDRAGEAIAHAAAHASAATAMFDRDMRYIAASQSWHDDYRLGEVNLAGRSHYEVFPDLPERWKSIHRRGLAGESLSSDNDIFMRDHCGVERLKWSLEPWRTMDGSIGGVIIVSEKLTVAQAEAAARDLAVCELHALFEQHVMGIVVSDLNGHILRANERFAEVIGRELGCIVGHRFDRAAREGDRIELLAGFDRLRAGACRTVQGRHGVEHADGSVTWLKHEMSMLDPGPGQPLMMVMFVSDATGRVELERRQRETDRIAVLAALAASLGHDMGNVLLPLQANLNAVEMLLRTGTSGPTLLGSVRGIREGLSHLQNLAEGLHHLAHEPSSDACGRSARVDLVRWWSVGEPLCRLVLPVQARFEVDIEAGLPTLSIGGHELIRVVLNLLANSRDAVIDAFGPRGKGAVVRFTARRCQWKGFDAARLTLADNGAGMSESVRACAGEASFSTKTDRGNSGLGLAFVKRAVENAGGGMAIDSTYGVGTTVSLMIPAVLGL